MIIIEDILSADLVTAIVSALETGKFNDGSATTANAGESLKNNLELAPDKTREQLGKAVLAALQQNMNVTVNAFPSAFSFPMFSRYEPGMYYDFHTDAGIINMGTPNAVRTDMSCTIFLSDPASYEGGELTVRSDDGERSIKLAAGSAALYGTGDLHRVEEVTRGARIAAVQWIQSYVRNADQRRILARLAKVSDRMSALGLEKKDTDEVSRTLHDLLRMWSN